MYMYNTYTIIGFTQSLHGTPQLLAVGLRIKGRGWSNGSLGCLQSVVWKFLSSLGYCDLNCTYAASSQTTVTWLYVCNTNFFVCLEVVIVMILKFSSTIHPLSGKMDDHESFAHATSRDLSWECM